MIHQNLCDYAEDKHKLSDASVGFAELVRIFSKNREKRTGLGWQWRVGWVERSDTIIAAHADDGFNEGLKPFYRPAGGDHSMSLKQRGK